MQESDTILVVEDDARLRELLTELFEHDGYTVFTCSNGLDAVGRIQQLSPDLVVLDINLPRLDGFAVCREVRPNYKGGILMLTARGEEIDELVGLDAGADDYLAKPVAPHRLLARVRAILRRTQGGRGGKSDTVRTGGLEVVSKTRTVTLDDVAIHVSSSEFDLLWLLATHLGDPVSREAIFKALKGHDYDGVDRSIDLRISKLRQCLGDDPKEPKWIKTVRGSGYLLAEYR